MAIESTPSRNEDEYFARENAGLVAQLRARLDQERAAERERLAATATVLRCPHDGAELVEREHHGVKIDVCPQCAGVWLDQGELDLLAQVDRGGPRGFFDGLRGRRG